MADLLSAGILPVTAELRQPGFATGSTTPATLRDALSVTYDGVAIEHLSPGTRGIVLLLLYLVIDKHDTRPLIIDQPEENLDPKSVFEELEPHFREAHRRCQVVIVTHNANLVVNPNADQVIIASAHRTNETWLPTLHYVCGSLENPLSRNDVCEILGVAVIAEGVESPYELLALSDLNVHTCQGYLFAKPAVEQFPAICWPHERLATTSSLWCSG